MTCFFVCIFIDVILPIPFEGENWGESESDIDFQSDKTFHYEISVWINEIVN